MGSHIYQISHEIHFKSRAQAFNIPTKNEAVATDTIFCDTPAIDSGVTVAQIFVHKDSLVSDFYPINLPSSLSIP